MIRFYQTARDGFNPSLASNWLQWGGYKSLVNSWIINPFLENFNRVARSVIARLTTSNDLWMTQSIKYGSMLLE
jgi:hypothetical protein